MTAQEQNINKQRAFRDCEWAIAQLEELKSAIIGDHIKLNAARLHSAVDGARESLNNIEAYISRMEERN